MFKRIPFERTSTRDELEVYVWSSQEGILRLAADESDYVAYE